MAITIEVYGVPVPKGSTRAFMPRGWKRPIITADNTKTKPWQESIVAAARDALGDAPPLEGPVQLRVWFFMPRPVSAPRRVVEPEKKPDLDKLVRALKDGLTRAGAYRDDAQVVHVVMTKAFAGGRRDDVHGGVPRVVVQVEPFVWGPELARV